MRLLFKRGSSNYKYTMYGESFDCSGKGVLVDVADVVVVVDVDVYVDVYAIHIT